MPDTDLPARQSDERDYESIDDDELDKMRGHIASPTHHEVNTSDTAVAVVQHEDNNDQYIVSDYWLVIDGDDFDEINPND